MAVAPIVRIPRFEQRNPFVDRDGRLSNEAHRRLNDAFQTIEQALTAIATILGIQEELEAAVATANAAAASAQAAADAAAGQAAAAAREQALVNSYIEPASVLTASPTTITIAAHTRYYADGTNVAVSGGTIGATAEGDTDYVFYDDPMRAGGTVTYQVSTTPPVQTGDRHVVGAVNVPLTGNPDNPGGSGPRPPGYVTPIP
jgi:hypothetical protein